jgi:Fe2+ transport system protein B
LVKNSKYKIKSAIYSRENQARKDRAWVIFLMHLMDCSYGWLVSLLAWSVFGEGFFIWPCVVLVPVGAIIRLRNHVQTEEAIEHHFGIKTSSIIKDGRNPTHSDR